jgi:hypothetical protein
MFRTNHLATRGAIIGYRRNGTPIRLIAGASPEGDSGSTSTDPGSSSAGDSGAPGDSITEDGDTAGTGAQPATTPDDTPKVIAALRGDFKAERAKRQAAEQELADVKAAQAQLQASLDTDKAERARQMDLIAKAMGLKADDEPPTPEKLAAQLAEAQRSAQAEVKARETAEASAAEAVRQAQRERALMLTAHRHDANAAALLDSRSFMDTISALDPAAGDFTEQLTAAIKGAVDANPAYKATPKRTDPPRKSSGGEFNAQPGGGRQWTDDDVAKASPAELETAMKAGLLTGMGVGVPRKRAWRRH